MRFASPLIVSMLTVFASGCFAPTPVSSETDTDGSSDGTITATATTAPTVDGTTTDTPESTGQSTPCVDPMLQCGAACVDPSTDLEHCGGCDSPCAANELCVAGSCTGVCDEGLQDCGGECVDTSTDPAHCGGCDSPCTAEEICDGAGSCVLDCEEGLMACGDACVDVAIDELHCGGCDSPCATWESCDARTCVPNCAPRLVECDGACIDPSNDPTYCGAEVDCGLEPGTSCGIGEVCNGGSCELVSCAGFAAAAFDAALSFPSTIAGNIEVGIAWDGVEYWSTAGGSPAGDTEGQHDAAGASIATFAANIDFRSIFTQGDGSAAVYARGFNDPTILLQDSPGVFVDFVDLVGGTLDSQMMVAWDPIASEFIGLDNGTLNRWDPTGAFIGTTVFVDYGVMAGENEFPQNRGVAWGGGCYLTINNGLLSAWDPMGVRVDTTTLNGAGADLGSNLSVSFANGHVFTSDDMTWRGYAVF